MPAAARADVIVVADGKRHSDRPNDVEACNRELAGRTGDVVLLGDLSIVSPGWLTELSDAAHSEERTAFAWPLSNVGSGAAQRVANGNDRARSEADIALEAVSGLPRFTTTSLVHGGCVYLRSEMLDAIGLLDASFSTLQSAILDWVMRAQTLGFFGKRANHAYVQTTPGAADEDDFALFKKVSGTVLQSDFRSSPKTVPDTFLADDTFLAERHPHLAYQVASFRKSLDGNLTRHAIDFMETGKLRVAYDIRHIPRENAGARSYAVNLAKAMADLPQVELCVLVNTPEQAEGLNGPIIKSEEWRDEFAVIHKPGQFFRREELAIPFGSSAHVVVTDEDLFAHGGRGGCRDDAELETHRATTSLSLLCASGILVHSESARDLIGSEYGIPGEEITVARLGALADSRVALSRQQAPARVEPFPWEQEAQATFEMYRAAVLRPSERSLQMRRSMHEAILAFASPSSTLSFVREERIGVRIAWKALNGALQRRFLARYTPISPEPRPIAGLIANSSQFRAQLVRGRGNTDDQADQESCFSRS